MPPSAPPSAFLSFFFSPSYFPPSIHSPFFILLSHSALLSLLLSFPFFVLPPHSTSFSFCTLFSLLPFLPFHFILLSHSALFSLFFSFLFCPSTSFYVSHSALLFLFFSFLFCPSTSFYSLILYSFLSSSPPFFVLPLHSTFLILPFFSPSPCILPPQSTLLIHLLYSTLPPSIYFSLFPSFYRPFFPSFLFSLHSFRTSTFLSPTAYILALYTWSNPSDTTAHRQSFTSRLESSSRPSHTSLRSTPSKKRRK